MSAGCACRYRKGPTQLRGKAGTEPPLALLGKLQLSPDTIKRGAFSNCTGIAFINRRPQCNELRFLLQFLALQGPQRRPDNFTGIFTPATLDLGQHEAV